MVAFSPIDAAFEGFRVTREKPLAVLTWAGLFTATIVAAAILIVMGFAPRIEGAADFNPENPQEVMAVMTQLAPVLLALMTVWVILSGVISAAIYRRVLAPQDGRNNYLRLGKDEWRQIGALFLCLLAAMAFNIGVSIALALPARLLESSGAGAFGRALIEITTLALQIWFGLRLSLVPAMTFANQKIDILSAWKMTRGHLPRLLGMFVLSVLFAFIVWLLISIISTFLAVLMAGGDMSVMSQLQNPQAGLSAAATGAVLVYFLISLLTPVLLMVIIQAPTAVAYKALAAGESAGPGDI